MISACWQTHSSMLGSVAQSKMGTEDTGPLGQSCLLQGLCTGSREQHPLPQVSEGSCLGAALKMFCAERVTK